MQKIHFYKMHGTGNDFILIDNRAHSLTAIDAEVLKEMCAFHTGIGADGIMFLSKCNEADFKLAYYNSNGFPAEMCGNGARCAIYLAHLLNIIERRCKFLLNGLLYEGEVLSNREIRLKMQAPQILLSNNEITDLLEEPFESMCWLDTGVPHLVINLKEPLDNLDILRWGRYFRLHPRFQPRGSNVNFVRRLDPNHLDVRVYERGVERETLACGTGTVACGVFAAQQFGWSSPLFIHAPGGQLQVDFDESLQNVYLTGPVAVVFEGDLNLEYFQQTVDKMIKRST